MTTRLLKIVPRVLPWIVAAGILVWLFDRYPPAKMIQALQQVRLLPFILYSVGYFILVGVLDTWALSRVFSQFEGPTRLGEVWPSRCVSYLLSLVNYNAGQAALAGHLKESKGFGFFKTLGNIFFVTATDLYLVIAFAFLATFFIDIHLADTSLSHWIRSVAYVALAALFLHLAFWHRWFSKILPFRVHFAFVDWIRGRHLFSAFHQAKLKDYFKVALYRFPLHIIFIANWWIVIELFNAKIAWQDVLGTVPIIYLLGALPISPGGLGVTQAATVELLKNKISSPNFLPGSLGAQETLFALSLAWVGANYLLKVLVGFFYYWKYPIRPR